MSNRSSLKFFAGMLIFFELFPIQVLALAPTPGSFRSILLDKTRAKYLRHEIGDKCLEVINELTTKGYDLKSEILEGHIKPLSEVKFSSGVQDQTFFHWTHQSGLADMDLGVFFEELKTRYADRFEFWRRVLYLAEDPESSKMFGDKLYQFDLDLRARTISYDEKVWSDSLKEIALKFPAIGGTCQTELNRKIDDDHGSLLFNNLFLIIAEDTGVEVIDFNQKGKWFQLLGPAPVLGVKSL